MHRLFCIEYQAAGCGTHQSGQGLSDSPALARLSCCVLQLERIINENTDSQLRVRAELFKHELQDKMTDCEKEVPVRLRLHSALT